MNGDAFEKILKEYPYWKFKQFFFDEPNWKHFNDRYQIQINSKYLGISQKDLNTEAIQALSIVELKKYISIKKNLYILTMTKNSIIRKIIHRLVSRHTIYLMLSMCPFLITHSTSTYTTIT